LLELFEAFNEDIHGRRFAEAAGQHYAQISRVRVDIQLDHSALAVDAPPLITLRAWESWSFTLRARAVVAFASCGPTRCCRSNIIG
jgi:hypothetical protein